jgi:hypothetical protein
MKTRKQQQNLEMPQAGSVAEEPQGRKPWKKKTPVEAVLAQIDRLRNSVADREEELKQAKRQLQKLDEARKLLEEV